jgi:hypothetical protein
VSLGAQPVSVGLRAVQTQEQAPAGPGRVSPLSTRLSILPENRRLYLIAKDLMAAAPPEAIYRLYLDLPAGAPDDPINSHYVGLLHFFDAVPHGGIIRRMPPSHSSSTSPTSPPTCRRATS